MAAKKLGALWKKTSKAGNEYFSGVLELGQDKVRIVVFPNNKENERQPDYSIFESEPREGA